MDQPPLEIKNNVEDLPAEEIATPPVEKSLPELSDRLDAVEEMPHSLTRLREEILASLVMLAQIPSPSGQEEERSRYLLDRFVEAGLPDAGADDEGNAYGTLPGLVGVKNVMLVAHLDTIVPRTVDHNVVVQADRIIGPGISDNAMGAAVVSMIPACLDELGLKLDSNLILLGSVKSLEHHNHSGICFHLENTQRNIDAGIVIEGLSLGRLNYFSIGTLRGDITTDVRPMETRSYGSESAIIVLNHVINRILSIETPSRPYTRVRIGKIHAGVSYDIAPLHAELGFEVVSHSDNMIDRIEDQIEGFVAELSARHTVDAHVNCFLRRRGGGIPFSHPLVRTVLDVMGRLDIPADQGHSPSELSEFIERDIPAVTLGITHGEKNLKKPDHVLIEPMLTGIAQVISTLLAVDRGALK